MSEPIAAPTKPRSKFWKWIKRLILSALALVVLLVAFHRPLLRFSLEYLAPKIAKRADYELAWKVRGDFWNGLGFEEVHVVGPEGSPLRSLEIRDFNALYSLPKLYTEGLGAFLASVKLEGATLELDLTVPSKPKEEKAKPDKAPKEGFPDFWVGGLELRDITLKLVTPTGDILVDRFTLTLEEDQEGEISFDRMVVPQAKITYGQAKGVTYLKDRAVSIKELQLTDDLKLEHLVVALADFTTEVVGFDVKVQQQGAGIHLEGRASHLKSSPQVDAKLALNGFTEKGLLPWVELPPQLAWQADSLNLEVKGEVLQPQALELNLALQASKLWYEDYLIERAELKAQVTQGGHVKLETLSLGTGENRIQLTGESKLPERWQDAGKMDSVVQYEIEAPRVEEFWILNPQLRANIEAMGEVTLKDHKPDGGKQRLRVEDFAMGEIRVKAIDAAVELHPQHLVISSLKTQVDASNALEFKGNYEFPPVHALSGNLKADLSNVPNVLARVGVVPPDALEAAALSAKFDLHLLIQDLTQKLYHTSSMKGDLELSSVQTPQVRIPSANLKMNLQDGMARVEAFEAQINDQDRFKMTAQLHLAEEMEFESQVELAVVEAKTLTQFVEQKGEALPTTGSLELHAKAEGKVKEILEKRYDSLLASVNLTSPGITWGEAKVQRVALKAQLERSVATLSELTLALDDQQGLKGQGYLDLKESQAFEGVLQASFPDLKIFNPWLKNLKQAPLEAGSLHLDWKGQGQLGTKDVLGKASVELKGLKTQAIPKPISLSLTTDHDLKTAHLTPLHFEFGPFVLEVKANASEEMVNVDTLRLTSNRKVWLDGRIQIPLRLKAPAPASGAEGGAQTLPIDPDRPMLVKIESQRIALSELFESLGMKPPVKGSVELDVDLQGKFSELRGQILTRVYQIEAEATQRKLSPADATFQATIEPKRVQAELEVLQKPLQPLTATVDLPLSLDALAKDPSVLDRLPLKAQVTLPRSDLSVVKQFVPVIQSLRGHASVDVELSGTLKEPKWQGAIRAEIPDANFTLAQLPEIKNFQGEILFRDRTLQFQRLTTSLAGGRVSLSGQIDATDMANPSLDLRLSATEALLVRDETMSLRTNADLACRGTLQQAEVAGSIDLVRGRVFKEIEFLPLSLPNQLPPPPPAVRQGSAPGKVAAPAPFDQWRFDIAIRTKDHIRLLGNVLNGGVSVNLKAHGTGANPIVEGEANLVGARLHLPFSRLAFSRGRVIFSPDKFLQPELDIQGDAVINQYEVMVSATGSAFNPQLRMSSSPPLSEGDIATLLATGSTSGDLRSSEGMAANRAAFLLISQTYRKLFNKTQPVRYDDEPPKLSFNFSLLNTGSSQRSVSAIYELSPKLQAIGTMGENGTFRGLLYYLVRFR